MVCSVCGEKIVLRQGGLLLFMGSPVTARASGLAGQCHACGALFCSVHAAWRPMIPIDLPPGTPQALSPYCPHCDKDLTGGE